MKNKIMFLFLLIISVAFSEAMAGLLATGKVDLSYPVFFSGDKVFYVTKSDESLEFPMGCKGLKYYSLRENAEYLLFVMTDDIIRSMLLVPKPEGVLVFLNNREFNFVSGDAFGFTKLGRVVASEVEILPQTIQVVNEDYFAFFDNEKNIYFSSITGQMDRAVFPPIKQWPFKDRGKKISAPPIFTKVRNEDDYMIIFSEDGGCIRSITVKGNKCYYDMTGNSVDPTNVGSVRKLSKMPDGHHFLAFSENGDIEFWKNIGENKTAEYLQDLVDQDDYLPDPDHRIDRFSISFKLGHKTNPETRAWFCENKQNLAFQVVFSKSREKRRKMITKVYGQLRGWDIHSDDQGFPVKIEECLFKTGGRPERLARTFKRMFDKDTSIFVLNNCIFIAQDGLPLEKLPVDIEELFRFSDSMEFEETRFYKNRYWDFIMPEAVY